MYNIVGAIRVFARYFYACYYYYYYYYTPTVAGQLFERKLDLCVPHKLRETDKFTVRERVSAALVVVVVHSHCFTGVTLLYILTLRV